MLFKGIKIMGTPLATLAQFKTYKSIPIGNTKEDAMISQILASASDYIKEYCQRSFNDYVDDDLIEYHEGSTDSKVFVQEYPIIDLIFEYSSDGGATYSTGIEFTEYFKGVDYISSGTDAALWNPIISHNAIKITMTAGFEELPADLIQATLDLTEYFRKTEYNSKSSLGTNMVERSQSDGADITMLPAHIYRVLANYRNIV